MGLLSRRTPLDRKRRKLEKELTAIQEDLLAAADPTGGSQELPEAGGPEPAAGANPESVANAARRNEEERLVRERSRRIRDDRFAHYFANSFERARPLRHERRIQRNKAIMMSFVVLALLIWAVFRFAR